MENKLKELLKGDEQLLWSGKPNMKMLDKTHKTVYLAKAAAILLASAAFLVYYMMGVSAGTIPFKAAVLVLLVALDAVLLLPDFMDVGKLNKAVYGVTNKRLMVAVNGYVHTMDFDKIDDYKFDTDADGQTTLMCGASGMKVAPARRRLNTIFGGRMSDNGSVCDRFVMYGIPEADKVEKLLKKYVK